MAVFPVAPFVFVLFALFPRLFSHFVGNEVTLKMKRSPRYITRRWIFSRDEKIILFVRQSYWFIRHSMKCCSNFGNM